ncbi:hypothetical protein PR048_011711 [Dryococelus australis]|uniref:TLC domain-containing protein n=1 Tax=Dryococelus australis TaxID=614101 RepID=A0ABQ9HMD1_9NEOP|nr:hypothetical protein PR048_011711 [Dryococelus australis]
MAVKGRKLASKTPQIFSHEFIIQNHADIVSCVAMLFVIALMVQATSPFAYMFIAVHHNTSAEETGTHNDGFEPVQYMYGWKDACAVFFYFLICIVMHAIVQEYILDKISRKLHLSKVKHSKFNESGQLVTFYLMSVLWGGDIIWRENFLLNIPSLWEGYPHSQMTFMFKFYYIIQMSYWLHCYPELYFQKTKREEMMPRIRYATLGFIYVLAAYLLNFTRIGICLLVLHYISEASFHVARLIYFVDKAENGSKVLQNIISNSVKFLVRVLTLQLMTLFLLYILRVFFMFNCAVIILVFKMKAVLNFCTSILQRLPNKSRQAKQDGAHYPKHAQATSMLCLDTPEYNQATLSVLDVNTAIKLLWTSL